MNILIYSSILTSAIFLAHSFFLKGKRSFLYYIGLFVIFSVIEFFFTFHKCHGDVFDKYLANSVVVYTGENTKPKDTIREANKDFLNKCWEMAEYHESEAKRCFFQAEDSCLLLPNVDCKEKAKACFTTTIALLYPASPSYRIISGIITASGQYGLSVMDEWQYIESKLTEAKYHYEMQSHYILLYNHQVHLLNAKK